MRTCYYMSCEEEKKYIQLSEVERLRCGGGEQKGKPGLVNGKVHAGRYVSGGHVSGSGGYVVMRRNWNMQDIAGSRAS